VRSDEWARYHEVQAIKEQSGKFGKRAEKVMVLIWGDLSPGVRREGPNIKGMGTDSWHSLNKESRNGRRTAHRGEGLKVKPEVTRPVLSQAWG
jgi:hypothetical protein